MVRLLVDTSAGQEILNVDLSKEKLFLVKELSRYLKGLFGSNLDFVFYHRGSNLSSKEKIPHENENELIFASGYKNESESVYSDSSNKIGKKSVLNQQEEIRANNVFVKCKISSINLFDDKNKEKTRNTEDFSVKSQERKFLDKTINPRDQKRELLKRIKTDDKDEDCSRINQKLSIDKESLAKKQDLIEFLNELEKKKKEHEKNKNFLNIEKPKILNQNSIFPEKKEQLTPKIAEDNNYQNIQRLTNKTSLESNILQKNLEKHQNQNVPRQFVPHDVQTKNIPLKNNSNGDSTKATTNNVIKNEANKKFKMKTKIEEELLATSSDSDNDPEQPTENVFVKKSLLLKNQIINKNLKNNIQDTVKSEQFVPNYTSVQTENQNKKDKNHSFSEKENEELEEGQIPSGAVRIPDPLQQTEATAKNWTDLFKLNAPSKQTYEKIEFEKIKGMSLLQLRILMENKNIRFRIIEFNEASKSTCVTNETAGKIVNVLSPEQFEVEFTNAGIFVKRIIRSGDFFELFLDKKSVPEKSLVHSERIVTCDLGNSQKERQPQTPMTEKYKLVSNFKESNLKIDFKSAKVASNLEKVDLEPIEKQNTGGNLNEIIRKKIIKQVNFYYSDNNYFKDDFIQKHMDQTDKTMRLDFLLTFPRIKKLTKNLSVLIEAIKSFETNPECNYALIADNKIKKK